MRSDKDEWRRIIGAAVLGGGVAVILIGIVQWRNVEAAKEAVRRAQEAMRRGDEKGR